MIARESIEEDPQESRLELFPIPMEDMYFGEFMPKVRKKVEAEDIRVVVIDSLAGMSDLLCGP